MVAGKVKVAMGLQRSPANNAKTETPPKPPLPSPSSAKGPQKPVFSRSFGVYFPRSSAQVQPRPPDVTELLRLVEELRERESRLKTELLEQKLLKESVAILPVLENEITAKEGEIEKCVKKIEGLEGENERLRGEVEELKVKMEEERRESEGKVKALEAEVAELKKAASERSRVESKALWTETGESDELSSSQRFQGLIDASVKSNLIKSLRKGVKCPEVHDNQKFEVSDLKKDESEPERPRHSRCNSEEIAETSESVRSRVPRKQSYTRSSYSTATTTTTHTNKKISASTTTATIKSRPTSASTTSKRTKTNANKGEKSAGGGRVLPLPNAKRLPRDSGAGAPDVPANANARDMIGEIENRSSHLLAIKTDVETQGDFIRFLIKEVENAAFTNIEDVVPFVKWLDDELSFLVDERAVLKHFNWPEQKADALREAAFGFCDLKKLESEASSFRDVARQPCAPALKKMQALLEKLEHGVYNLSRMRESAAKRYKLFQIPIDWILETGFVSQIKLASVKLAMKYMKRVSAELETVGGGPEEEELIVQGVRFAFRVHQFAGGFDVETMRAFQELRDKARSCHIQCQNSNHRSLYAGPHLANL
ncbi:Protein CHUP1, chloroplastic [Vitis vinifera]|uniref:Protein CHUP1, chloroplastic n=1 Tax=Vitis vinifera TaxID=29760 RepID=A0A438CR88_VITVI|nr:Protein CHUP1, chloroplastic [Vitis vinifera]